MNVALGSITLLIAGIRFISKYLFSIRQGFGPDDWTLLAAGFIGIPCIAFNILGLSSHGLGKDIWTLAPGDVASFARWLLAMEIFYVVIMTIVKISLSLFYLDLFPGAAFRKVVWGTIIFNIASGLSFVIGSLVQCVPLSFTWEQFSNSSHGHCINMNSFGWANAAVNVATDLWLTVIPLVQLYKLDTHWRRKLSAAIMFMTGVMCDQSSPPLSHLGYDKPYTNFASSERQSFPSSDSSRCPTLPTRRTQPGTTGASPGGRLSKST
ncbi:uncharacterized protein Triagg1_3823 [Trichoderma aggressivum f. europaeum]|uniref:Rhodopsin domain-containing protein n=1 Tax=Trichoderma aggressivum f. europaeum TaxID=173218 RepID=A0AAE1M6Q5_9HYPO|nr:hypothetical protein Triagg1_3823 [Trichoderma aggressivum f. europaeum]